MKPIDEHRTVSNWFLGLKLSTLPNYKRYLSGFCRFTRLNPDQLIALGKKDPTEAHTLLKRFYLHLTHTTTLHGQTRSGIYHTVRSFYAANDVLLGKEPRGFKYIAQHDLGRLLTRKEVFKMLTRWMPATKEKAGHQVNAAPSERGAPLSSHAITKIIHYAANHAGIQAFRLGSVPDGRWGGPRKFYEIFPHMFRRYWKHQMREGGVKDNDLLRYMMGQTPSDISTYDRFDDDYVKREYRKAEPY